MIDLMHQIAGVVYDKTHTRYGKTLPEYVEHDDSVEIVWELNHDGLGGRYTSFVRMFFYASHAMITCQHHTTNYDYCDHDFLNKMVNDIYNKCKDREYK